MINEEQKYKSEIFKIIGFCLMTPIGKLVLSVLDLKYDKLYLKILIIVVIALLFYFGIISILRGTYMVSKGED